MEIIKIPHKILAKKTAKVAIEDIKNGHHRRLILEMKRVMKENEGIGLAANQVGQDLRLFIIDEKLADEAGTSSVFFNPEITEYSKDTDELEEGCLSIPQSYNPIKRAKKIKIKAIDENGNKIKLKARGFLARVLQHETDHLNGLTIKNRIKQ